MTFLLRGVACTNVVKQPTHPALAENYRHSVRTQCLNFVSPRYLTL